MKGLKVRAEEKLSGYGIVSAPGSFYELTRNTRVIGLMIFEFKSVRALANIVGIESPMRWLRFTGGGESGKLLKNL